MNDGVLYIHDKERKLLHQRPMLSLPIQKNDYE